MRFRLYWVALVSTLCCLNIGVTHSADLNQHYGPIVFKSKQVAKWRLQSSFDPRHIEIPYKNASWAHTPAVPLSSVTASRSLTTILPQQVYATFNTTDNAYNQYTEWFYIPEDVGASARLGWLIGNPAGLNMAVEYEYRQVLDNDNNALTIGVSYLF
jgi:hypothetical protein